MFLIQKKTCGECPYFVPDIQGSGYWGQCKRYPRSENKTKTDWCGENPNNVKTRVKKP